MKPIDEIVTRDGLVELLKKHGFEEHLSSPTSPVISLRKYAHRGYTQNQEIYALCFVFPAESADERKCAGFAGMGCAEAGKPVGSNFTVNYGQHTYKHLIDEIARYIEPHIGKIL